MEVQDLLIPTGCGCFASDQAPWECTCTVAGDGPDTWVSDTHRGDPDEVPGSWLCPGTVPAVVGICGVNQWMRNLLLCLSDK